MSSTMIASTLEGSWEKLRFFIQDRGGFIDGRLKAGLDEEKGGCPGLIALAAIRAEEAILTLPKECIIFGGEFPSELPATPARSPSDLALACSLIVEGPTRSTFASYLDTLPSREDFKKCLPSYWPHSARLSMLCGSPLLAELERNDEMLQHDFALLSKAGFLGDSISFEDFKWAVAVVDSRALEMDGSPCLAPAMDMMNHRRPRMTSYSFKKTSSSSARPSANAGGESGDLVVTTLLPVAKQSSVDITYGAKGNAQLLQRYGFTLEANTEPDGSSNNTVLVKFELVGGGDDDDDDDKCAKSKPRTGSEQASSSSLHGAKRARLNAFGPGASPGVQRGGGDRDWGREVELRLASAAAPKHYVFTPFTKALDACRVLTMSETPTIEQSGAGRDGSSGGIDNDDDEADEERKSSSRKAFDDFLEVEDAMFGACQGPDEVDEDGEVNEEGESDEDEEEEEEEEEDSEEAEDESGSDEDDFSNGTSTKKKLPNSKLLASERLALSFFAKSLRAADAKYDQERSGMTSVADKEEGGDETGPSPSMVADCARVVRGERAALRFYAAIAELGASILALPLGDSDHWHSAASALLKCADEEVKGGECGEIDSREGAAAAAASPPLLSGAGNNDVDPLLSPLMSISVVVETYLQVKFRVKVR